MEKAKFTFLDALKYSELLDLEELDALSKILLSTQQEAQEFLLANEYITQRSILGLKVMQDGFASLKIENVKKLFQKINQLKAFLQEKVSAEKATADKAAADKAAAEKAAADKAAAEKAAADKAAAEKAAADKAAAEKAAADKAAAEKAAADKAAAEKAAADKAAAEKAAADKAAADKAAADKAAADKAAADKAAADKAAAEKAAAEKAAAEKAAAEKAAEQFAKKYEEEEQAAQERQAQLRKQLLGYPKPGDTIGKCLLVSILGKGATSQVYLGFHSFLRKNIAIKILSPSLISKHSNAEEEFLAEAMHTAKLDHPNLVRVLDADQTNDYTYMTMEFVDGQTLLELLERSGSLKPLNAIRITQKVLQALNYAYQFKLIHRDIKPGNIMINRTGEVKLADLGLAKAVDDPDLYQTSDVGTIQGTPYYLAPEHDAPNIDCRADMYSLGATLYNLLTGSPPFTAENIPQMIYKHIYEQAIPPQEIIPEIGDDLGNVILKLLAKKPEDRYPDYPTLIQVFEHLEKSYAEQTPRGTGQLNPSHLNTLEKMTKSNQEETIAADVTEKKKKGFFKNMFGI